VRLCATLRVSVYFATVGVFSLAPSTHGVSVPRTAKQNALVQTGVSTNQSTANWMQETRARIEAHDLAGALAIVNQRLSAVGNDTDAMGYRARLLVQMNLREQAVAEYRRALAIAPRDTDLLLGLATLLHQDGNNEAALSLLDQAMAIPPPRVDVMVARGLVLSAMGRRTDARDAFRRALASDSSDAESMAEARAGILSLQEPPRFEFDIGNETDTFNYINNANTQTIVFVAKPNPRWIFSAEGDSYQRFGADAEKFLSAATYRFTRNDSLTLGGGAGNANEVISRGEAFFEYGHGFRISEDALLRGIETSYQQHWFWYDQAHVLVLTGTVAADLAHDMRFTVSGGAARSGFAGTPVAWEPSGYGRLDFPLPRISADKLLLNLEFAVGSENFSEIDQVGAFASRTYGGGVRWSFAPRDAIIFYAAEQYRTQGRNEGIYGAGYQIRF